MLDRKKIGVEEGIRRDCFGYEAYVSVQGVTRRRRFSRETDIREIRQWRALERSKIRSEHANKEMLRRQANLALPRSPSGWCYLYVALAGDDLVKIGMATDPEQRLARLQTANGHRVTMLAVVPAHAALEAAAHQKFSHCRAEGEWFRLTPEVRVFIEQLQDGKSPIALLWDAVRLAPVLEKQVVS